MLDLLVWYVILRQIICRCRKY